MIRIIFACNKNPVNVGCHYYSLNKLTYPLYWLLQLLIWLLLQELTFASSLSPQNSTYLSFVLCKPFNTILCPISFLLWAVWHSLQHAFFLCRVIKLEGTLEIIQSKYFLLVLRKLRLWEVKVSCCCVWSLPIIHLQRSSQTDDRLKRLKQERFSV